jgi:hypothetical protein
MNLDTSNGNGDTGHESNQGTLTFDQAALKRWLTTDVDLRLPRWAIVAPGFVAFLLLLFALD